MYEITFQFENGAQEVKFSAAPGSTILEAAKSANVAIDAPCNGNGSCGKCRVKLVSGEVTGVQTGHISDEDYAAGWRLSCSTKPAGDITVLVPDIASAYQSRMKTADLSSGEEIAIFNQLQQDVQAAGVDFANDFVQAVLTLDEPTLDDTMPDTERLARFAQDAFDGCTEVRLTYHTVKKLAKTLREANFKVQITGTLTDGVLTIMDVSEKEDAPLYGCAIDIGTTTVTGVLMDLKTGTLTAKASAGNGQIRYGADVINVNSTLSKLTDTAIQPYPGADGKPVYTILSVYYDLDFHTLTFDTMGGSKIAPETVRHGLTVAKPKDPVNGGFLFDGWYTDKTYRTPYNFATPLTQDTTIYAKWFLIVLPGVTVKKNTPKLNTADHFAYVQGYPDGTVKPAGNITRAETAAILFRLMDDASRKTYYSTKSGFRDVASGSWYNTYVATLNNAGVITDSSNGYFRPNEAITRAELAAMLAKFSETTSAANYFNDVSAKYWAANAIAICAKLGWITGYPDGTFRPDRNVTRAELMAMINRATGRAPKSADAFLPGMKTWIDNTSDKWYYLDVQEATNSHSYTVKGSETWTALTSDPNWSLYE